MTGTAGRIARWAAIFPLALALPAATAPAGAAPPARSTPPAPAAAPAPLTNEDIVRLVVHGTAESVILREIATRPPLFDLDPGVVVELQQVGVSEAIIAAMRARQITAGGATAGSGSPGAAPGATGTPASPGGAAAAPVRTGQVVIRFRPADKENDDPGPFAIAALPKSVTRPADGEVGTVSDLALAIFCASSIHVPDHWDSKTPLKGAPRHEMLLFRPGSTKRHEHGFDLLALDRAAVDPISLPAGRHALVAGLAGKHGSGDWQLMASDPESIEVPDGGVVRLLLDARTKIHGNKMVGFQVEQVFTLSPDPEPGAAPTPTPESTTTPDTAPTPAAAPAPDSSGGAP